ncbi:MAG: ribonuclease P protein component [Burkholderiales bacterium]|nr:ribonuclease P protein component [Burkholderiales bacterium]
MELRKSKITKNSAYKEFFVNSNKIVGKYFVILYKGTKVEVDEQINFKYGITASKKIGNAVKRNWCKRMIRILVKQIDLVDLTKDLCINVIARKFMIAEKLTTLKDDFDSSVKKIVGYEKKSK